MNRVFGNDASQEKSVLDMDQALNEMIDTLEKMDVISNERRVRELIQRNWAMIFFIRQQDSHNFTLTAAMHDKIGRIQQMMNNRFERSTSSVTKSTEEKRHAMLNWTACYKNECQTHFSEKKGSG